jgi:hypothetical protein
MMYGQVIIVKAKVPVRIKQGWGNGTVTLKAVEAMVVGKGTVETTEVTNSGHFLPL